MKTNRCAILEKGRGSGGLPPSRRFTLVELLIVIAILTILAALLLPALSSSRDRARQAQCISNIRDLTLMHLFYVDASGGVFCPAWDASFDSWESSANHRGPGILARVVPDSSAASGRVFECPSAKSSLYSNLSWTARYAGYGMNYLLSFSSPSASPPNYRPCRITQVKNPSKLIVLSDTACFLAGTDGRPAPTAYLYNPTSGKGGYSDFRHSGASSVSFVDGHAVAWNALTPRPADSSGWEKRLGYLAPDDAMYDPFWKKDGDTEPGIEVVTPGEVPLLISPRPDILISPKISPGPRVISPDISSGSGD